MKAKCTPFTKTGRKRPLQDYTAWPNYGTPVLWQSIREQPLLACECLCLHLHQLGLINATKETQRSMAAHVVAAKMGLEMATYDNCQEAFKAVGKRLKQLYRAEPAEYIELLPPSPADLLRQHPLIAKAVFSPTNLPCACPLDSAQVLHAQSKICMRGESKQPSMEARQPNDIAQLFQLMAAHLSRMHQPQRTAEDGAGLRLLPPGTLDDPSSPSTPGALSPGARMHQALCDGATQPGQTRVADGEGGSALP